MRFVESPQKPLELILARNLLTSISTPSFLVDSGGTMVFYNEAAAAFLGRSFEDTGQMTAAEWTRAYGPFTSEGEALSYDGLHLTQAVREGRPAHGGFRIRNAHGDEAFVEAVAFPLVASETGSSGAMILFWPQAGNGSP